MKKRCHLVFAHIMCTQNLVCIFSGCIYRSLQLHNNLTFEINLALMNSKFARKYIKNAHSSYGSGHDNSPTGDDMKIFKLGLDRKELADNPNFIAEYLKFFIEKNDHISKF